MKYLVYSLDYYGKRTVHAKDLPLTEARRISDSINEQVYKTPNLTRSERRDKLTDCSPDV